MPTTPMSKARARRATSVPMAPSPTTPRVRPASPPRLAEFHRVGGSSIQVSGSRFSKASMAARANLAMAGAAAPRELVRTRSPTMSSGNPSMPAPRTWTQRIRGVRARARPSGPSASVARTSASAAASGLPAATTVRSGSAARNPSRSPWPVRPSWTATVVMSRGQDVLEHTGLVDRGQVVLQVPGCLGGLDEPSGGAHGEDLHEGEPRSPDLRVESPGQKLLGAGDVPRRVDRAPSHEGRPVDLGHQRAGEDGAAVEGGIPDAG